MESIYKEYFHVPENGKCSEKVIVTRVFTSVLVILACLFAMSLTAYAYFTVPDAPAPAGNFIGSAKYELDIQVTSGGTPILLTEENTFMADAGKEYVVTLKYVDGSATTGFCGIKIDRRIYHTEQIGADLEAEDEFRSETKFTIAIEGTGSILVELIPHWGTSSFYDTYVIPVAEIDEEIEEEADEKETEELEEEELDEETEEETIEEYDRYITMDEVLSLEIVDGIIPERYVVQVGDTLWEIAKAHDTTVDKLVAYNGIENRAVVTVGLELKIPPADWEIPKEQGKPAVNTPPVTEKTPTTTSAPKTSTSAPTQEKTEPDETTLPTDQKEPEAEPASPPSTEETNS